MTDTIRRADDLAFRERRHVRARAARGQSEGRAEEGREYFPSCKVMFAHQEKYKAG